MNRETRKDWEYNQALVEEQFLILVAKKRRRPTIKELMEATGLSKPTIERHMKEIVFTPPKDPMRILTSPVIAGIAMAAINGNAASQKLWMQIMEGWNEKKEYFVNQVKDEPRTAEERRKAINRNLDALRELEREYREYKEEGLQ